MIRIIDRDRKRTKIHVRYEFDHEGKVYLRKTTFKVKEFDLLTEQEILSRIRGFANRERAKIVGEEETKDEE